MPRAILRVVCAARWNDGEEAGHGNGDEGFMADCVIVCFFSGSFYLFLSVYLSVSICHSVSFGFYGGAPGAGSEVSFLYKRRRRPR
jgi:hypothetical protein